MQYKSKLLIITLMTILVNGCRTDEVIYPAQDMEVDNASGRGVIYVLNEGNMGSNKAQIDRMNLETGVYTRNYYGAQNPNQMKELGDVGNDIQRYGGKLYAVINCSHKVEVMDLTCHRIGQVDIPNCRNLAFANGKVYVSAYVGSVVEQDMPGAVYEVDTTTLSVTREVKVGRQPDELIVKDGMLYVCNTGGYTVDVYDSTLSVVDIATMQEVRRITVGQNPNRIRMDADGRLWVTIVGNRKDVAPGMVVIKDGEVAERLNQRADNMVTDDGQVYILDATRKVVRKRVVNEWVDMVDVSHMEKPYGLMVKGNIYVTDARNYVSSGELYCYSPAGQELWHTRTGDIPGHLCYVDMDGEDIQTEDSTKEVIRVYDYRPAMGQFVNTMPRYEAGDDMERMCQKAAQTLNDGGLVTLGGWGGRIILGLDQPIINHEGRDFRILGNAFLLQGYDQYGNSEPGIVMVAQDKNHNGLPDDEWYELAGSAYNDPTTNHHYVKTYSRSGDTLQNPFHSQPYYPEWIMEDEMTITGACLGSHTTQIGGQIVQEVWDYGYVDNRPNTDVDGTGLDISWAVDEEGQHVELDKVDFIMVYTAVDEVNSLTGESSTEVGRVVLF